MEIIKVNSCFDCPFVEHNSNGQGRCNEEFYANCMAPASIHSGLYVVDKYFKAHKSPQRCPLKKVGVLTIIHKR